KMAVDAIELAYERGFVTTFAIGTGDSDFTPLVHKLRELDKRVIGIGVQSSTSALLPPACDEFLFYDRLPGVEGRPMPARSSSRRRPVTPSVPATPATEPVEAVAVIAPAQPVPDDTTSDDTASSDRPDPDLTTVVTSTLAGLARAADGPVRASTLKRAILRKDPTFDEGDQGFRGFGELLRHLENRGVVALAPGTAAGDPEVSFPEDTSAEDEAFALFATTVRDLEESAGAPPQLSGLKDQMRKRDPGFSEKRYGFNGFLSFARAARARDLVTMEWDEGRGDYQLSVW
ncbi:MAG TPA: NYN domain-containing protein, partial [Actinomycetospora sp.]|nr:NYN domain-containing protein [Actinomycetospora sp.]